MICRARKSLKRSSRKNLIGRSNLLSHASNGKEVISPTYTPLHRNWRKSLRGSLV